jgi:hypothetical protein
VVCILKFSHQFYLVDSNFPVDENEGVIEGFCEVVEKGIEREEVSFS